MPSTGPRTLARQSWPPSISPDYIGVGEKGYAVLGDSSGRLVIVDLKQEDAPRVISELDGIGKRVAAMAMNMQRAYAVAWQEKGGEGAWALLVISLMPATDPGVLAQMPLSNFSDPSTLALSADVLTIGGTALNGENQVIVFGGSRGRKAEPTQLSAMSFDRPVTQVELQDRYLIVVQAENHETQIEVINLSNPRAPARGQSVRLKGDFEVVAKTKDFFLVGGQNLEKDFEIHAVAFKPAPRVVRGLRLPGVSRILDGTAQKNQLLLLVNHKGRQAVLPVSYNKALQLVASNVVLLPTGKRGAASKARIVATLKEAYVASDWGGVQVLTADGTGWQYMYSHTIPRLPAAAVTMSAGRVVLGGADLKIYSLDRPEHPALLETTDVGSPIKSMFVLGRQLLVQSREGLTLRSFEKPSEVHASLKISGAYLAYDPTERLAYMLTAKTEKTTTLSKIGIEVDDLKTEKSLEIPNPFRRAAALGGKLLLAAVNDLTLFKIADTAEQLGTRNFTNLAIRDLVLTEDRALLTAIDQNSRGFLLILDAEKPDFPTLGSVQLPHDGTALAVSGGKVVSVGRKASGQDLATVIDINNPAQPKIVTSMSVIEAASAVSIRDNLAVVVGRGLEIITLS